jgi:hypothetical protein
MKHLMRYSNKGAYYNKPAIEELCTPSKSPPISEYDSDSE